MALPFKDSACPASVVQLVERLPSTQNVVGSNPALLFLLGKRVAFRHSCLALPCLND